jgi:hypothetical protein
MIMPMVCLQRLNAAAGLEAMVLLSSCAPLPCADDVE